MPAIDLEVKDLVLDHDNPRFTHAEGQQDALQKVVANQKTKLVKLAQSIAERGLNPMDRLLVLRVHEKPERFIALEGNRRVAVFKMLTNPSVMTGLDMPPPMRSILTKLAAQFSKSKVEPIACFELISRQDGDYWLRLRHKGEMQGAGIVGWTGIQSARYDRRSPALQAFEMVLERGGLPADQRTKISERFPLVPLHKKLQETVAILEKVGVPRTQLVAVSRSLSVAHSPFNVELFHLYVHERFATPSPAELKAAWNNAQPLFERIWP